MSDPLLVYLKAHHVGRDRAIKLETLAALFETTRNTLQERVAALADECVCASHRPPCGVWVAASAAEMEEPIAILTGKLAALGDRVRRLERARARRFGPEAGWRVGMFEDVA